MTVTLELSSGNLPKTIFYGVGEEDFNNNPGVPTTMPTGYYDPNLLTCANTALVTPAQVGQGSNSDRFVSVLSVWVSKAGNIYIADNNRGANGFTGPQMR